MVANYKIMKLTNNFTLEELTKSATATAYKLDNTPSAIVKGHLKELAESLQTLRDMYGKPITITSGYRSPKVNAKVGGSATSQHTTGYAVDMQPTNGDMQTFKAVVLEWAKTHKYDQIILEQCDAKGLPTWVHFGVKHATKGQRKQILTATKKSGKWVYQTYKG